MRPTNSSFAMNMSLALAGQQWIFKYGHCLTLLKKRQPIRLNNQLSSLNQVGSEAKTCEKFFLFMLIFLTSLFILFWIKTFSVVLHRLLHLPWALAIFF